MAQHTHPPELLEELNSIAGELRCEALRMIYQRGQGHPGGALSCAEIVAALYFHQMRIEPEVPDWPDRDRFILSKGHASAILYPALTRKGYFPADELDTWGDLGGRIQGHPDRLKTPGVDMSAGCLGHGISIGVGLCLAKARRGGAHTLALIWTGVNSFQPAALTAFWISGES